MDKNNQWTVTDIIKFEKFIKTEIENRAFKSMNQTILLSPSRNGLEKQSKLLLQNTNLLTEKKQENIKNDIIRYP
ncbi:hypothetical protein [Mariniflexile sp.]|uniref:hypothetical protein n=1 Tax=Mariniflexile sp. TaxID=1979402 RepID=UPI00404756CA